MSDGAQSHVKQEITVNVTGAADTTAPVVSTVTPANVATATHVDGTFDLSANITEANTLSSCEYTINGSTWVAGTPNNLGGGNWTCTATNINGGANDTALTLNIRGTDNSSNVGTGTAVTRTVDSAAPTDGTLTVTPGNTQNGLSWTAASDTGSGLRTTNTYDVRFLTGATPPTCTPLTGASIFTGTGTSTTHTGLTNGTQYSYRVCAYDNVNNVSTGATGSGTPTAGTTPPDTAITAPAASAVLSTSPYSITGTATAGTNPLQDVQVSTDNGGSWSTATGTASWSYSWTLPSEDYVAHTIQAKARDNQGTPLEDPTPASVSIWVDNVAPAGLANSAPANAATGIATNTALTASAVTDGNPGTKEYFFQIATDAGFTANVQQSAWQTATSWTPGTALSSTTTYYWHVRARDAAGNQTAYTTTWSFTTTAAANNAPAVPSALAQFQSNGSTAIASGGTTTNNVVVLKATVSDPDSNPVALEVDIDSNGSVDCVSGVVTGPATATATCTALADGNYNWQARAKDSLGATSAWVAFTGGPPDFIVSAGVDIGIDTTPPTESGLAATPGDTVIDLAWDPADDGAGSGLDPANTYKVVRATGSAPADCTGAALYQGNLNLFSDSGLTNGTTYYYRVCAYDRVGNVSAGQTTSATPGSSCTVGTPTVSIVGSTSKTVTVDGGFVDYTVQVVNNDTGACAAVNFDLVAVDSNGTAFYPSAFTEDPLNVASGASVQTTMRVTARANQSNGATNSTYFYTAAVGGHAQSANSGAVTTTITVSGGGCIAAGSYLNANGDQLTTSR